MNSLIAIIALAGALLLSIVGNAWQWRHSGVEVTRAEGNTDRCADANVSLSQAALVQNEALWKCVGEDQIAEVVAANERATAERDVARDTLSAYRADRAKDLANAKHDPDAAVWAARPVPPAISRLLSPEGHHAGTNR